MAAAPVKAPESLAESQMRQLDNQVLWSMFGLHPDTRHIPTLAAILSLEALALLTLSPAMHVLAQAADLATSRKAGTAGQVPSRVSITLLLFATITNAAFVWHLRQIHYYQITLGINDGSSMFVEFTGIWLFLALALTASLLVCSVMCSVMGLLAHCDPGDPLIRGIDFVWYGGSLCAVLLSLYGQSEDDANQAFDSRWSKAKAYQLVLAVECARPGDHECGNLRHIIDQDLDIQQSIVKSGLIAGSSSLEGTVFVEHLANAFTRLERNKIRATAAIKFAVRQIYANIVESTNEAVVGLSLLPNHSWGIRWIGPSFMLSIMLFLFALGVRLGRTAIEFIHASASGGSG
jgi:hypothetical protein